MKLKIPQIPTCPFCKNPIAKPTFLPLGFSDYEAGVCACGAIYVCDPTGFSRGAVFLEALLIACAGDWDLALNLIPEEDYQEIWIENYDPQSHTIPGEPLYEGRKIRGALCFLKLTEDIEVLKEKERKEKLKRASTEESQKRLNSYKKRLSKLEMEKLLIQDSYQELVNYVVGEPLNLSQLQKFLYHPEEALRKRAALSIGKASKVLSEVQPERVLDFLKRLLYAASDSAASPWGALEAVGEIIRETGPKFKLFIKNLFGFLHYPEYIPYALSALERIAEKNREALKEGPYLRLLSLFPKVASPEQALIVLIFTHLKGKELLGYRDKLKSGEVEIFDYATFKRKKVDLSQLWDNYESLVKESIWGE
uniref:PBS lyase n=1 Tax=Caldimicrobium thiodismutans TaxID=1653476 RepID=A0A832LW87_9BACT